MYIWVPIISFSVFVIKVTGAFCQSLSAQKRRQQPLHSSHHTQALFSNSAPLMQLLLLLTYHVSKSIHCSSASRADKMNSLARMPLHSCYHFSNHTFCPSRVKLHRWLVFVDFALILFTVETKALCYDNIYLYISFQQFCLFSLIDLSCS